MQTHATHWPASLRTASHNAHCKQCGLLLPGARVFCRSPPTIPARRLLSRAMRTSALAAAPTPLDRRAATRRPRLRRESKITGGLTCPNHPGRTAMSEQARQRVQVRRYRPPSLPPLPVGEDRPPARLASQRPALTLMLREGDARLHLKNSTRCLTGESAALLASCLHGHRRRRPGDGAPPPRALERLLDAGRRPPQGAVDGGQRRALDRSVAAGEMQPDTLLPNA